MKEFLIKESELSHWLRLTSHATANADIKVLAELMQDKLNSVPYRDLSEAKVATPFDPNELPF